MSGDGYCECPLAGYCEKHGYTKTTREHEMCQGINLTPKETRDYRLAWEQGTYPGRTSEPVAMVKASNPTHGQRATATNARRHDGERPGSELRTSLTWFGAGSSCCGQVSHVGEMDRRGCDWCESNLDRIAEWVAEDAAKAKVSEFSDNTSPEVAEAAKAVARQAITNARAKAAAAKVTPVVPTSNMPDLETSPLDDETVQRTLLYYLFPLGGESAWCWRRNLDQLAEHRHLFNAGTHFTIASGNHKGTKTESPEVVVAYLNNLGFTDFIVYRVTNTIRREAEHFRVMLKAAESLDQNAVFCVAHAKGVTHADPKSVVHRWTELMYQTVIGNWDNASIALESYGTAGAFKRYGDFKTAGNHHWHYSGTFYWVRSASVFRRNWSKVDRQFFGMESWPGLHFRASEAACLFADNTGDIYKPPALQVAERDLSEHGLPGIVSPEEYQATLKQWGIKP